MALLTMTLFDFSLYYLPTRTVYLWSSSVIQYDSVVRQLRQLSVDGMLMSRRPTSTYMRLRPEAISWDVIDRDRLLDQNSGTTARIGDSDTEKLPRLQTNKRVGTTAIWYRYRSSIGQPIGESLACPSFFFWIYTVTRVCRRDFSLEKSIIRTSSPRKLTRSSRLTIH